MGSSSRLWNALYRSEYWYVKNSRYPFLLQWKIERGELKKFLEHYSRYSASFENIENSLY